MPDQVTRMETMLFDYETTYRTDFRSFEMKPSVPTLYKEKPTCLRPRARPLKDVHTLFDWKSTPIPFSFVHEPRPIIGTDPRKIQEAREVPKDTGREHAIKTRPRVVMTPAVSMDDIVDPEARKILCDEMYTSDMTRGTREAVTPYLKVKAPLPGLASPCDPISLPKLNHPYVSPEWRMPSVPWDSKQLRSYCNPTRIFWCSQKLPPCRACDETAAMQSHRKMVCRMMAGKPK